MKWICFWQREKGTLRLRAHEPCAHLHVTLMMIRTFWGKVQSAHGTWNWNEKQTKEGENLEGKSFMNAMPHHLVFVLYIYENKVVNR